MGVHARVARRDAFAVGCLAAGTVDIVWMHGHDMSAGVVDNYRAFAEDAHGRSPLYETLANEVATDTEILLFLQGLPPQKRQPNLLLRRPPTCSTRYRIWRS